MPSKKGLPGFTHRGVSMRWSEKRQRFEGKVTVAKRPDGTYDRRSVYGKDREEAKAAIEKEQKAADTKMVTARGRKPTVENFFTQCITEIMPTAAVRPLRENTARDYMSMCRNWLFPQYGRRPIDDFDVPHLDDIYNKMYAANLRPSTVLKQHTIIRKVLREAQIRNLVTRNVAAIRGNPGSAKGRKKKRLTQSQADAFFAELDRRPRRVRLRWKVAICAGPRQGEALGLRWLYTDYDRCGIYVEWQIQRHKWKHGCTDSAACAAKHCRTEPCPPTWDHGCTDLAACKGKPAYCPARKEAAKQIHGCPKPGSCKPDPVDCPKVRTIPRCRFHRRNTCPPPCQPGCTSHAAQCEFPTGGGLVFARPKTLHTAEDDEDDLARETVFVALPKSIMDELRILEEEQKVLKKRLGDKWEENDLVFCNDFGKPIDPKADYAELREILTSIGIDITGTHLTRRTAARLLKGMGFSIDEIGRTLRQKNRRVTQGYVGEDDADTDKTAAAMEKAFFGDRPLATVTPIRRTAMHRKRRAG